MLEKNTLLTPQLLYYQGVYGYKNSDRVHRGAINSMVKSATRKKTIYLYQTARYSRNVLHLEDFVTAITELCLKKKPLKFPMYNLVSNESTTIERDFENCLFNISRNPSQRNL